MENIKQNGRQKMKAQESGKMETDTASIQAKRQMGKRTMAMTMKMKCEYDAF